MSGDGVHPGRALAARLGELAALLILVAVGSAPAPRAPGPEADPETDPEAGSGAAPGSVLEGFDARTVARLATHSPLPPAPLDSSNAVAGDPAAVRLGHHLFFEPRLSSSGTVSCATCHDPALGLSNGLPLGAGEGITRRHVPSLWNVAHHRWFNWDGSRDSLWAQATGPLEADEEMGSDRRTIARLVATDPSIRPLYEAVFGPVPAAAIEAPPAPARPETSDPDDPRRRAWTALSSEQRAAVTSVLVNCAKALDAYQRRLRRADAPFDRFVEALIEERAADAEGALAPAARRGARLFASDRVHCRSCHVGPLLSDGEFHGLDLGGPGGEPPSDAGRYAGLALLGGDPFASVGRFSDDPDGPAAARHRGTIRSSETWGQMRTPSLRNVALSPPYMHDGRFESLEAVVDFYVTLEGRVPMGHHQETILVPLDLTPAERADLVAFLESLTGRVERPELLRPPTSIDRDS